MVAASAGVTPAAGVAAAETLSAATKALGRVTASASEGMEAPGLWLLIGIAGKAISAESGRSTLGETAACKACWRLHVVIGLLPNTIGTAGPVAVETGAVGGPAPLP